MNWEFVKENWEILIAVFGALSAGTAFLWKKRKSIGKRIKIISLNFVDFVTDKDATTIASIHAELKELSTMVRYELRPNGGKSFRDTVEETKKLLFQAVEENKEQTHQIQAIIAEQNFLSEIDERGFFKMDLNGNCTVANIKTSKIVGVNVDRVSQKEWWSLIHPDDVEPLEKRWKFAYEKECDFYSVHRIIVRDLNEVRTLETIAKPYYINGEFAGFNGVVKLLKIEELNDDNGGFGGNRDTGRLSDRETGAQFWKDRELKPVK